MKKFSAKEILIPAVSLFAICLVVTALLAVTNQFTAPKIEELAVQTENQTKREVMPQADSFSEAIAYTLADAEYTYFEAFADEQLLGYVFNTAAKGYGGDIRVMVGVNTEGKVTGVSILSISETAGLGMNAKNESFLEQFVGKAREIGVAKNSPAETEIQALTGATITSNAMAQAVNTALAIYTEIGGEADG